MATVKVKSTEFVRRAATIIDLAEKYGVDIVVQRYSTDRFRISPIDLLVPRLYDVDELQKIQNDFVKHGVRISTINFV